MTTPLIFAGNATLGMAATAALSCALARSTVESDIAQRPNGISAASRAAAAIASRRAMRRMTVATSAVYRRKVGTKAGNSHAAKLISTRKKLVWTLDSSAHSRTARAIAAPANAARPGRQRPGASGAGTAALAAVIGATPCDNQMR